MKGTYSARYRRLLLQLAETRQDAGLTQAQVAKAMGKPQSFVSKVESGERRLDVIELFDFLRVLKREPIEFVRMLLHPKGER